MQLDITLLCLIVFVALLGALAGFARQLAQIAALIVAYLCASPLGKALGAKAAGAMGTPIIVGVVVSTLCIFLGIFFAVRYIGTLSLQRALAGRDPTRRTTDRALGFAFGALKAAMFAYVVVCALSFIETSVQLGGRRLSFSPKDSVAFELARNHNLFAMAQLSAAEDLTRIRKALGDPKRAELLQKDPAYRALRQDARFPVVLESEPVRRALETGDVHMLLRSNAVMQLVRDPLIAERIEAAARASER